MAEFAYNNARHASLKTSPFYAFYKYHPRLGYDLEEASTTSPRVPAALEKLEEVAQIQQRLRETLKAAQDQQAKYYNQGHKPMAFQPGDLVRLSTKNLRQIRPNKKLSHKWIGPFRIEKAIGSQAYRLWLPEPYRRLHPVFHISLLEPYKRREGDTSIPELPNPQLIEENTQWVVEKILDRKEFPEGWKYLLQWEGYPEEYNSWEPENFLSEGSLLQDYEREHPRVQEPPKKKRRRGRPGKT
jgi:hypothetical protein